MQRDTWQFRIPLTTLKTATQKKLVYHRDRKAWWEAEQLQTTGKIKESGISTVTHQHTGGKSVDVVLDVTLTARLSLAAKKVDHHHEKIEYFERWGRALEADQSSFRELDISDMAFFGL